jgi:hypothetical protein
MGFIFCHSCGSRKLGLFSFLDSRFCRNDIFPIAEFSRFVGRQPAMSHYPELA